MHCGVTPSSYQEPLPEPGRFRLLTVGRLEQVKGIPLLLDAVAAAHHDHPELRLDVVGDGPHRAQLEQYARDLGLTGVVRFLGVLDQAAVRAELRAADAFVLASFAEGLPVVLMEALAARTPVLATRIMGVPELVEDGVSGRLVPPADVDSLVTALRELAELTPEARRRMGDAGRQVVEAHFDARTEAQRLSRLFARYAGTAGRRRWGRRTTASGAALEHRPDPQAPCRRPEPPAAASGAVVHRDTQHAEHEADPLQ